MNKTRVLFLLSSILFLVAIVLALILVLGGRGFVPAFLITGDVKNVLKIESFDSYDTVTVKRDGKRYRALLLSELIKTAEPIESENHVYIKGDDELLVKVDGDSLDGMHIVYTKEYGWEMINDYHPLSSNIKRISQIWVVAKQPTDTIGVSVITQNKNLVSFTPGQFFVEDTGIGHIFEGKSQKKHGDTAYNVEVLTTRKYMDVKDIVPDAKHLLVMGAEGGYAYDSMPGRIELRGNRLDYVFCDGKTTVKNVRGVLVSPPKHTNMDAFHESLAYLSSGDRVVVFLVDGFGYHQYEYAVAKGYAPFMKSLKKADTASTVYKPVTYAGLAAMLTGQPPCINGVYQRKMPDLKVDDIFKKVEELGKTAAFIEGNIKILNTSIEPQLNADDNLNESTDEEVMICAEAAIQEGFDFIFVHFHGVDDSGHDTGDLSEQTLEKIKEMDRYIEYLTQDFAGRVIITADHGMHETEHGGNHGNFVFEDMIIPYISYDSGE